MAAAVETPPAGRRTSSLHSLWSRASGSHTAPAGLSPRGSLSRGASRRAHAAHVEELEASGLGHEAAVLAEFKSMIHEAGLVLSPEFVVNGDTDATLRRFLRARKYKLDAAFAMLEKSLAWRKRVGADDALRTPLPAERVALIRECRPSSYIGFHREGFPIFIERLGKLDAERIQKEGLTEEQLMSYHLREMEFMAQVVFVEASRRTGHTVDRIMTIMDANGLTFSMLTGFAQRLFRALTASDSDNYPEICHHIYIVNNSTAFSAIWRVLRVFVDIGTREKIRVLGSGDPMLSALLQEFDAAQIPSFLGGALDYDERRRQWMEIMDAAMEEQRRQAVARKDAADGNGSPAGTPGNGPQLPINGFERLPALRIAPGGAASSDAGDGDSFHTAASATSSRLSSSLSLFFDAIEMSSPSLTRGPAGTPVGAGGASRPGSVASGAGSVAGLSPGASPRHPSSSRGGGAANGAAGAGPGSFDAVMPPQLLPAPQHSGGHLHRESRLAVVPSGDLPNGRGEGEAGEGPQPKCCVIS